MPAPSLDARGIRLESVDPSMSVTHLAASVQRLGLDISCLNCTSPGVAELTELLKTPEAAKGATDIANDLFETASRLLGGRFLQVQIDRALNEAGRKCPHSPDFDANAVPAQYEAIESTPQKDSLAFFIAIGIGMGCLIVLVSAVVLTTNFIVRRRNRKWLATLPAEKLRILWLDQEREKAKASEVAGTPSMFQSPDIPLWVRYGMPLVILGNIGFFLSGHLSLGATVAIIASFADETFEAKNFFEFSVRLARIRKIFSLKVSFSPSLY